MLPIQTFLKEDYSNDHFECAVIKDAIVDMGSSFPAPNNSAASPDDKGCRRAHQGLYNELVNYLEEHEDQVKISYNNIVYGFDPATKQVFNTFWVYKKQVILLKQLKEELLTAIPNDKYGEEPTIVLIYPWKEFSLGTRFKHIAPCDTEVAFAIERIDYYTNSVVFDFVPKENAIQEIIQDGQSARKLFVKIINDLIDRIARSSKNNVIPYVWGGSSFSELYLESAFYKKDGTWHREGKNDPYSGYDCSEFVMRMAQIAGIYFPWKTTTAIERGTRMLSEQDTLEEGDLIFVQGHVMVVSNIRRNEIIESRGYGSGYGCIHRITLSECFDGINSYENLLSHYYNNKKIRFKDKKGIVADKFNCFKLLKLIG